MKHLYIHSYEYKELSSILLRSVNITLGPYSGDDVKIIIMSAKTLQVVYITEYYNSNG